MFDLIEKLCQPGERFTVHYEKQPDNSVTLVVKPELKDDASSLTDETAKQCRAMLMRPLVMRGSHSSVVEQFRVFVHHASDARQTLHEDYRALTQSMSEMSQKAKRSVAEKQDKAKDKVKPDSTAKTKAAKEDATPATAPKAADSSNDTGSQPTNLFG